MRVGAAWLQLPLLLLHIQLTLLLQVLPGTARFDICVAWSALHNTSLHCFSCFISSWTFLHLQSTAANPKLDRCLQLVNNCPLEP